MCWEIGGYKVDARRTARSSSVKFNWPYSGQNGEPRKFPHQQRPKAERRSIPGQYEEFRSELSQLEFYFNEQIAQMQRLLEKYIRDVLPERLNKG